MKYLNIIILILLSSLIALPACAAKFSRSEIFTHKDKLTYWEYEISKELDAGEGVWTATLKRWGETVETFDKGGPQKEMTHFGLFPFRGAKIPQLMVGQYSGGAHCCFSYWIFNLDIDFRIIHQTEFPIDSLVEVADLDGDGRHEIVQSLLTFDYFDRLPHAYSPSTLVIFQYDPEERSYIPANPKFASYLLKGLEKKIQAVKAYNAKTDFGKIKVEEDYQHLPLVLQVVIDYVYAGKEKEAWDFFDKEYKLSDKEAMRGKIKRQFEGDQVYEYIYGRL